MTTASAPQRQSAHHEVASPRDMVHSTFLYGSLLGFGGGLWLTAARFLPGRDPRLLPLVRKALSLSALFLFATGILWGGLWLSERLSWFEGNPVGDLLFMGAFMIAMAATLWAYLRALRPISEEIQRIRQADAT